MIAEYTWERDGRPQLALITNHGYAGVEIPVGGAADTGGQNFYVNSLAVSLERLGYRVTIFARGGFPFFRSERLREEPELLSTHVRYIYIPGGGDEFIRKEDIAVALDEEVEWLDGFIRDEARELGCAPWEVYEIVNTHYWDAAVLGMRLVERWRADRAMDVLDELVAGLVDWEVLIKERADRHYSALGESLPYVLGRMLIDATTDTGGPLAERAVAAWTLYAADRAEEQLEWGAEVRRRILELTRDMAPALHIITASEVVGHAVLNTWDPDGTRSRQLVAEVDRHVWTPHSLGCLKEENFRGKSPDIVRPLKFNERRAHERAVCRATRYFAATSEEIAARLHTHFGVELEQIFYFPPCVDTEIFRDYSSEVQERVYAYLAERSGLPVERIKASRFIFETSRQDRTKRKDLLLQAFARVAREVDDVLLFIGGGPDTSPVFLENKAIQQGDDVLRERACLLGFIPDEHLAPLFSMADIFASMSEMEGFGMSAAQAAGCGTPVVLSSLIPFAVQYVPDAAIVVPPGDEAALAAGLLGLLGDDADRERRGKRLAELTRVLDWDVQAQRFLDHLRQGGLKVAPGQV